MTNKNIATALTLGFVAFTLSILPVTTVQTEPSVWFSALGVASDLSGSPSDLVVKVKKKKKKKKHDEDGDDRTQQGERSDTTQQGERSSAKEQRSYCSTFGGSAVELFKRTCQTQKDNSFTICHLPGAPGQDLVECCCNYRE